MRNQPSMFDDMRLTLEDAIALSVAYALAGVALQHARLTKRHADQRHAAALRLLDRYRASDARLQTDVEQRERAIADLLDRLNAAAVANVAARRTLVLGMPRHRVDPRYINLN